MSLSYLGISEYLDATELIPANTSVVVDHVPDEQQPLPISAELQGYLLYLKPEISTVRYIIICFVIQFKYPKASIYCSLDHS